jgi:hypothetical protein
MGTTNTFIKLPGICVHRRREKSCSRGPIYWKIPADVIRGKKYEKAKRKRKNVKEKGRKEKEKGGKGKENEKRGSKRVK